MYVLSQHFYNFSEKKKKKVSESHEKSLEIDSVRMLS